MKLHKFIAFFGHMILLLTCLSIVDAQYARIPELDTVNWKYYNCPGWQ